MSTEHDQHDDALDKVLASIRDAVPPEGIEARIYHRLQQHPTEPAAAPSRWRDMFANVALIGEWWRGAITGAAVVIFATGLLLFTNHLIQTRPDRVPTERNNAANRNLAPAATPVSVSPHAAFANETRTQPCTRPAVLSIASVVPIHTPVMLRANTYAESAAPSRPAPELPLTAQERALVRLARTSPKQLAAINPVEYANLEAQSALKFEKFFAPPAPLPATNGNAATTSIATPEANSEGDRKPDSANPDADSAENPETY